MAVEKAPDLGHIDVSYVADLARLRLSDDERQAFQAQLDDVLEYVALLSELDVSGIEPTAHAAPRVNVMREDRQGETMPQDRFLGNAPRIVADALVRVPAVIDGGEH